MVKFSFFLVAIISFGINAQLSTYNSNTELPCSNSDTCAQIMQTYLNVLSENKSELANIKINFPKATAQNIAVLIKPEEIEVYKQLLLSIKNMKAECKCDEERFGIKVNEFSKIIDFMQIRLSKYDSLMIAYRNDSIAAAQIAVQNYEKIKAIKLEEEKHKMTIFNEYKRVYDSVYSAITSKYLQKSIPIKSSPYSGKNISKAIIIKIEKLGLPDSSSIDTSLSTIDKYEFTFLLSLKAGVDTALIQGWSLKNPITLNHDTIDAAFFDKNADDAREIADKLCNSYNALKLVDQQINRENEIAAQSGVVDLANKRKWGERRYNLSISIAKDKADYFKITKRQWINKCRDNIGQE